jgi:hypothetical protein
MVTKKEYDVKLWVELDHCLGQHFILGNPHTFKGRIDVYCPSKNIDFCLSISEIQQMSVESEYWIKGYLRGNEPDPPEEYDEESTVEYFQSSRYKRWEEIVQNFRRTGEINDL